MEKGQQVRFTGGPYGLVANLGAVKFEEETVHKGEVGTYLGKHPNPHLGSSWHVIVVEIGGRELLCPLLETQFEAVDA